MEPIQIITFDADHAGIYATEPFMRGPYNTPMLFRGTKGECEKQFDRWNKYPAELDAHLFECRLLNARKPKPQRGLPAVHPKFANNV